MHSSSLFRWILVALSALVALPAIAAPTFPVDMAVRIGINKIYQIDTINETYRIDSYLVANWRDPSAAASYPEGAIFENSMVEQAISDGLWIPALDFVNVIEGRNVSNSRVEVSPEGDVSYNERFDALFTTAMDFRKFPFDSQTFTLIIEPFSYPLGIIRFVEEGSAVSPEELGNELMGEWEPTNPATLNISTEYYEHLEENFSRISIDIDVARISAFYIFQIFIPLSLIIIASWSVFWIAEFAERLSVSFTLMLTVVAYNFYTSTLLPPLPFTTVIDRLVIFGYASIFASIVIIVTNSLRPARVDGREPVIRHCQYLFPLCSLLIIYALFLVGSPGA